MNTKGSPIATYNPDIYDVMYHGTQQDDVEWYCRKAIESGGPVLELGAGTGRIAIPVAEAGIRISGLDADAGMLDKLRQKITKLPAHVQGRIATHHGDMHSFTLEQQYALVIIPFRAFLHNMTREDQLATLRRVHTYLRRGVRGEVEFEVGAALRNPVGAPYLLGDPRTVERRLNIYERTLRFDPNRALKRAFATTVLAILWPRIRGGMDCACSLLPQPIPCGVC